jgi:hypothetical protein
MNKASDLALEGPAGLVLRYPAGSREITHRFRYDNACCASRRLRLLRGALRAAIVSVTGFPRGSEGRGRI